MSHNPAVHPCPVCGQLLSRQGDLKRHIAQLHPSGNEKLWKCQFCPYTHVQKSNVQIHAEKHELRRTGVRPYVCPEHDCDAAYQDPGILIRHRKKKHGYQPNHSQRYLAKKGMLERPEGAGPLTSFRLDATTTAATSQESTPVTSPAVSGERVPCINTAVTAASSIPADFCDSFLTSQPAPGSSRSPSGSLVPVEAWHDGVVPQDLADSRSSSRFTETREIQHLAERTATPKIALPPIQFLGLPRSVVAPDNSSTKLRFPGPLRAVPPPSSECSSAPFRCDRLYNPPVSEKPHTLATVHGHRRPLAQRTLPSGPAPLRSAETTGRETRLAPSRSTRHAGSGYTALLTSRDALKRAPGLMLESPAATLSPLGPGSQPPSARYSYGSVSL